MSEPLTKEYFEEQIDLMMTTVKEGFDAVDQRFDAVDQRFNLIEGDIAHIKERLTSVESEVRALSANMVTKQYLDAKFDQLLALQHRDSLFKRQLLLALEQAKVLTPEGRAKLEQLIPS